MIARVSVFVCGEPARGDDAAGFAAVDLLPANLRERVEVVPVGQLDILFLMDLPHAEATHRLEQMIRSYDPCISCATHFLDLRVEEA